MKNPIIIAASLSTLLAVFMSGCTTPSTNTIGENHSGFTYIPIDPFAVKIDTNGVFKSTSVLTSSNFLEALPDNAVRFSEEQYDTSNNVSYQTAGLSVAGGSYKITVDYINSDTANIQVHILRSVLVTKVTRTHFMPARFNFESIRYFITPTEPVPPGYVPGSDWYIVCRTETNVVQDRANIASLESKYFNYINYYNTNADDTNVNIAIYNIPVYIGIGLRLTAQVNTLKSGINISGFGAIGAAAAVDELNGSLVVQTLGVNGKSVSAALPIQSELNQTTIQNAIASVGSIKSLLYEPDTTVVPRVVGLYLPFQGDKPLVNAIISALASKPIEWDPNFIK